MWADGKLLNSDLYGETIQKINDKLWGQSPWEFNAPKITKMNSWISYPKS